MRLDKRLADALNITRSEAKQTIKKGAVTVNGIVIKSPDYPCGDGDSITADGKALHSGQYVYIMLNKPKGVISATDGKGEKTVTDLVPDNMRCKGLFPAGRLDKDTTGFVLLTNDGTFAHNILSPSKHVDKTYIALLDKPVTPTVTADFEGGMELNGEKLFAAVLKTLNEDGTLARIVIRQGLYHQIKRMFLKHGIHVLELRRTAIGALPLDETLHEGECRYITPDELALIAS